MNSSSSTCREALLRNALAAASLAVLAAGAQANRYTAIQLGGPHVFAYALNDRGEIVGRRLQHKKSTPMLLRNGRWHDLEPAEGWPYGLNQRGDLIGSTPDNKRAVWLAGGGYQVLDNPEGYGWTWSTAISDDRTIFGQDESDDGVYGCFVQRWQKKFIDIGMPDAKAFVCTPVALNDDGLLAGWARYQEQSGTVDHSFVWKDGVFTDIGALDPSLGTYISSMNRQDVVVGFANTAAGTRAFLWDGTTITDIGESRPFRTGTAANHINNRGEIVGWGLDDQAEFHALRFAHGQVIDLAKEVSNLGDMTLAGAFDIDDEGAILAQAVGGDGEPMYVLLVPER